LGLNQIKKINLTKEREMKFAKWVFRIAGIYGIVVLLPFYFLENNTQAIPLPILTHPEYYYGFVGLALAWQVVFLIIAADPAKYRLFMIPSVLEKFSFGGAVAVLYLSNRVGANMILPASVDTLLGILFLISFLKTRLR
jgi:hypothetical protein